MARAPALVVLLLRGGADGLALVPPLFDARLRELRPTLASPAPDDRSAPAARRALDVDGHFGLHPALAALAPLFAAGELVAVHGVGTDDTSRSHFEAQDRLELAGATATSAADGWLARLLAARSGRAGVHGPKRGALSAVAFGPSSPESLRGTSAVTVDRLADLARGGFGPEGLLAVDALYAAEGASELGRAGRRALEATRTLEAIAAAPRLRPPSFPATDLGERLAEAALLLRRREELGLDVVAVDHGGWDTHVAQGELLAGAALDLGTSLAAFRHDLGDAWSDVVVVALTEFGRRAGENVSAGTDHGRASCAFVGGGRLRARGVLGTWPGLEEARLEAPGDLRVTTDARALLAEIVEDGLGEPIAEAVFPDLQRKGRLGLFAA